MIYTITEEEEPKQAQTTSSISQWAGERGRIDKTMLTKHLTDNELNNSIFYTCGPPAMIKAMQDLLQNDFKIPKDRIKEEFTGY